MEIHVSELSFNWLLIKRSQRRAQGWFSSNIPSHNVSAQIYLHTMYLFIYTFTQCTFSNIPSHNVPCNQEALYPQSTPCLKSLFTRLTPRYASSKVALYAACRARFIRERPRMQPCCGTKQQRCHSYTGRCCYCSGWVGGGLSTQTALYAGGESRVEPPP